MFGFKILDWKKDFKILRVQDDQAWRVSILLLLIIIEQELFKQALSQKAQIYDLVKLVKLIFTGKIIFLASEKAYSESCLDLCL